MVWRLIRKWQLQSRGYIEIFATPFPTHSRVDLLVTKNTWTYFSKFCLKGVWQLVLATCFIREKRMFCSLRTVFKTFQFSLEHFLLFIVLFVQLSYKPTMFLSKTSIVLHHLNFNLQEQVWVFLFSLSISCLLPWFLGLLCYCWDLRYMVFEYGLGHFVEIDWMGLVDYDNRMHVTLAFMVDSHCCVMYHVWLVLCIPYPL